MSVDSNSRQGSAAGDTEGDFGGGAGGVPGEVPGEVRLRAAEAALRESEATNRALLDSLATVLGILRDVTENKQSGAALDANRQELEVYRDHLEKLVEARTRELQGANDALTQAGVRREGAMPARQLVPEGVAGVPVPAGARVLLAEDNPINQEVALYQLRAGGFTVDLAENGARAFDMASSTRYDLILMDMQMPVMDGLDATRAIRRQSANMATPIIAMTANAFASDRAQCTAAGMNDHIAKPVEPETLIRVCAQWLAHAADEAARGNPGADDDLPARLATIEGLDVESGMRWVRGQPDKYFELLQKFVGSARADVARAHGFAQAAQWSEAAAAMHSLRGAAATVGATRLHAYANALEQVLLNAPTRAGFEQELHALLAALDEFSARLDATQAPATRRPSS